ncbi:MAG: SBBP repeat-containing protein [Ignavibacteria bacterium]|nr:SBBP repeat-containing protein [Ignavibacteria bacterium]
MNKIVFIFLFIAANVTTAFSSVGLQWASRYNGGGNSLDWSYAIAMDPAGNVVVTGYSTGAGTGKDYKTIKYNQAGAILWEATFNGPINGGDYSNALTIDASGNIYVTGRVDYGTSSDMVTIKYNSQGVQQWLARYIGASNLLDEGKSIKVDGSGNVYVGGKTTSSVTGIDCITVKYNPDGSEAWVKTYFASGANEDYIVSIDVDAAGIVYAGGCSVGATTGQDLVVIKYNPDGNEEWVRRQNGAGNGGDALVTIKISPNGSVVAAGYVYNGSEQSHNTYTIKYDENGNVLWQQEYNGLGSKIDFATAMTIDNNDFIYVTGLTTQIINSRPDSNYATLKYDPAGHLLWVATYDGPSNSVDVSRTIFVDNASNVYISGSSKGVGSDDYATIKYNTSGAVQWIMSYNGTGNSNDYSSSVVADAQGNAYVTGRSTGSSTDFDYATLKYGDIVGVNPVSGIIPDKFGLYQNYPNPFNPSTTIKFEIPERSGVSLSVYNSAGIEVFQKKFGDLQPSVYEYSFTGLNLPSGVYFYRLNAGSFVSTKKMILLK